MRSQRLILYVFTSLGLLFCLQLAACGSQGIPGSQRANGNPHVDSSTSSFHSLSDWPQFSFSREHGAVDWTRGATV